MKKVGFVLLMLVASIGVQAQSVCGAVDGKYPVYCTVMGYNNWGIGKVRVVLDMGDNKSMKSYYQSLFDMTGKKLRFNTMMSVLDYMGKRGWKVRGTYYITESKLKNVVHYLLEKYVSDDSEKTEGLTLRTDSFPEVRAGKNGDDLY